MNKRRAGWLARALPLAHTHGRAIQKAGDPHERRCLPTKVSGEERQARPSRLSACPVDGSKTPTPTFPTVEAPPASPRRDTAKQHEVREVTPAAPGVRRLQEFKVSTAREAAEGASRSAAAGPPPRAPKFSGPPTLLFFEGGKNKDGAVTAPWPAFAPLSPPSLAATSSLRAAESAEASEACE